MHTVVFGLHHRLKVWTDCVLQWIGSECFGYGGGKKIAHFTMAFITPSNDLIKWLQMLTRFNWLETIRALCNDNIFHFYSNAASGLMRRRLYSNCEIVKVVVAVRGGQCAVCTRRRLQVGDRNRNRREHRVLSKMNARDVLKLKFIRKS